MKTPLTIYLNMHMYNYRLTKRHQKEGKKKTKRQPFHQEGIYAWDYLVDIGILSVSVNMLRSHSKSISIPVNISQFSLSKNCKYFCDYIL